MNPQCGTILPATVCDPLLLFEPWRLTPVLQRLPLLVAATPLTITVPYRPFEYRLGRQPNDGFQVQRTSTRRASESRQARPGAASVGTQPAADEAGLRRCRARCTARAASAWCDRSSAPAMPCQARASHPARAGQGLAPTRLSMPAPSGPWRTRPGQKRGPPHRANDAGRGHASHTAPPRCASCALTRARICARICLPRAAASSCRSVPLSGDTAALGTRGCTRFHCSNVRRLKCSSSWTSHLISDRCSAHAPTSVTPSASARCAAPGTRSRLTRTLMNRLRSFTAGSLGAKAPALGCQVAGPQTWTASLGPVDRAKAVLIRGSGV